MQRCEFGSTTLFVIWTDDVNHIIGFANSGWASIIPTKSLIAVEVYHWSPDKGPSYEQLRVKVTEYDFWIVVADGELNEIAQSKSDIETLLGISIGTTSPWQD